MLTARFQPRLQAATCRRARTAGRSAVLRVVAFKNGDEEQQVQQKQVQQQDMLSAKVTFQLPMHVEYGQEVAVVGAADSLGNWDVEKSIPMSWNDGDFWTAQAELPVGTPIEYKYIVRAGEGEVKAVVQWQPCNNLELEAAAEQPELTIRDVWEGQQHEVLPGTLPLPTPPASAEEPQPNEPVAEAAPEAPAAAVTEAVVTPMAAASEEVAALAAVAAAAVASLDAHQPEELPVAPAAVPVAPAAPAPRARRSTTSRAANGAKTNGANASKPAGGNSSRSKVVAAAATDAPDAKGPKFGSLSTTELKEVCKERGLSTKGQRKDLLARLQELLGGGKA